jgi:hypothetical protein
VADFSVALLPDLREDTSILEDLEQKSTLSRASPTKWLGRLGFRSRLYTSPHKSALNWRSPQWSTVASKS